MREEKLLTIRDVAIILGVSEKEVIVLAESGQLPAYKIGGVYLRFKRGQVEEFRRQLLGSSSDENKKISWREKINNFLYLNDFYILSVLLIALILLIIFRGH